MMNRLKAPSSCRLRRCLSKVAIVDTGERSSNLDDYNTYIVDYVNVRKTLQYSVPSFDKAFGLEQSILNPLHYF